MELRRLVDCAFCLTCDKRWPGRWQGVADQWRPFGVQVEPWLNGSPETSGFPPEAYRQFNNVPPPSGWDLPIPSWHHLRASRAMFSEALKRHAGTLLYLEDDCELTPDFAEVVATIELPANWELFYFGAYHWGTTEDVTPNLLRVDGSMTVHAVLLRASVLEELLALPQTLQVDTMLARFIHPRGHSYAAWPSIAVQDYDLSTITGEMGGWPTLFQQKGRRQR